MDGAVVQQIKDLALNNQVLELNGKTFATGRFGVVEEPVKRPDYIGLSTLVSFVNFIKDSHADLDLGVGYFVLINDDMEVKFLTGVSPEDSKRTLLAKASNDFKPFNFDQFLPSEVFNIMLQTRFVYEVKDAKELFKTMKTLQIDEGITLSDDGMTERVTVKRGMSAASASVETVKTRMSLAPYRIFPECNQPVSDFLVRIKGDREQGAHVGLWETDGGMWKHQAKEIIFSKLRELGLTLPIYC